MKFFNEIQKTESAITLMIFNSSNNNKSLECVKSPVHIPDKENSSLAYTTKDTKRNNNHSLIPYGKTIRIPATYG